MLAHLLDRRGEGGVSPEVHHDELQPETQRAALDAGGSREGAHQLMTPALLINPRVEAELAGPGQPVEFFLPLRRVSRRASYSRTKCSCLRSAHVCISSCPRRRTCSKARSSASSAVLASPRSFSATARISSKRARNSGYCARRAARRLARRTSSWS